MNGVEGKFDLTIISFMKYSGLQKCRNVAMHRFDISF